ncbi:MAG: ThuA domain-containing protein [Acidobacteria bacterium]|jgi:type 1 glutamine amidotransferase|nr:ThuA domain-containing protein [Acidobacteriota bacterium]
MRKASATRLMAISGLLILLTGVPAAAQNEQKRWKDEMFRGVLLDGHITDKTWKPGMGEPGILSRRDARKIVSQLKDAHAQYVYFDAKAFGGLYYNSDAYPQYKHWALGNDDFFGEFVAECRKAGIVPFAYVTMSSDLLADDHPEWRVKLLDGSDYQRVRRRFAVERSRGGVTCINSPGRKFFTTILHEIASKYDIAGYWLDGLRTFPAQGCGCEFCKARFKKETGHDLPRDAQSPYWQELLQWQSKKYDEYCEELRESIHAARPAAMVARNFSDALDIVYGGGGGSRDLESNADTQDFISHELRGGNIMASVWPRALRALAGWDKVIEMEIWRFDYPSSGGTYNVKSVPWLLSEMLSVVANGSKIQLYDNLYPDGTVDARVWETVGAAFREIEKREPWLKAAKPVNYAGLVWSKQTSAVHRAQRSSSTAVLGLSQILLRSQVPFEFITDRGITAEGLKNFNIVIMSDTKALTEPQVKSLRDYVSAGGGLVATYETSMWDASGKRRNEFSLADVFGVSYAGTAPSVIREDTNPEQNSFIKLTKQHPVTAGIDMRMPFATQNTVQLHVKPRPGTEALAKILHAYRNAFGYPPSEEETGYPGLVVNTFGKGRVVYFPADIGSIYYDYGGLDYRRMMVNAIRWAANSEPPAQAEAPSSVELTVFKQEAENRLVVHLVNFQTVTGRHYVLRPQSNGFTGPYIEDVLPAHDIKVTVKVPPGKRIKNVYLAPEREVVKYTQVRDSVTLTVPKVEQHRMVVVEFQP